jgi:uncharacterized protein (DUF924 family)
MLGQEGAHHNTSQDTQPALRVVRREVVKAAIDGIHQYWFGELDEAGMAARDRHSLWFTASPETDEECRQRFDALVARAIGGELDDWADCDPGLIALVLLLDQFTRNIHRGTPAAFSGDGRALVLAQHAIATGHYRRFPAIHQVFLYMPLEHSEDLDAQEECVELFGELAAVTGSAHIRDFARYAVAHRDVIARFGRFPHRNDILGRTSTREELAYLEQHGGF